MTGISSKNGPSTLWQENEHLLCEIMDIFEMSYGGYDSPRMTKELRSNGWTVSINRVAKIMQASDIKSRKPRISGCF